MIKVHEKEKESKPMSSMNRSNYTPIVEALKSSISRENGVSPTESSCTKSRERSSRSRRSNGQGPQRSRHLESDRSLDHSSRDRTRSPRRSSHKSRDSSVSKRKSSSRDRSRSPRRSSHKSRDSSVSKRKSSSRDRTRSPRRSSHKSRDSSVSKRKSSSSASKSRRPDRSYVTSEGTPFSRRMEAEQRLNFRYQRTLNHKDRNESRPSTIPNLGGWQMIGDSQFCRFGQKLLGLEREPMPGCPGRIGMCISGQTITDLHTRVKDNFHPISDKIILMIGTNNFLRSENVRVMCEELSALVRTLQKSTSNIILLTLPPIPKLWIENPIHFILLEAYNSHIRSLENGESVRIADISPLYMTSPPNQRCKINLFEKYFGGKNGKLDMIHLNRSGLEIIREYILNKFVK